MKGGYERFISLNLTIYLGNTDLQKWERGFIVIDMNPEIILLYGGLGQPIANWAKRIELDRGNKEGRPEGRRIKVWPVAGREGELLPAAFGDGVSTGVRPSRKYVL